MDVQTLDTTGRRLKILTADEIDAWKRNKFMCYDSVAERCSFQSGYSKEGSRWDTSHKPY